MWFEQPEAKETGHTPEIVGPGGTKDELLTKKAEGRKPQLYKSQSQDTLTLPRQAFSETHRYTQEAYSESTVQTVTGKSTVERKEQTHTSFSHTHSFSMSSSPVETDKRVCTLQQGKRPSQDTPPPAQGETEKQTAGLRAHHDKSEAVGSSHTAPHTLRTEAMVYDFTFTLYPAIYTLCAQMYVNIWRSRLYVLISPVSPVFAAIIPLILSFPPINVPHFTLYMIEKVHVKSSVISTKWIAVPISYLFEWLMMSRRTLLVL